MDRSTPERHGGTAPLRASSGRSAGASLRLAWILCLPFVAFGLFAANEGVNRIASGSEQGALLLVFGLLFAGLPVALLLAARRARQGPSGEEERRARHPDEPWLWNEAWADGRIRCGNRSGMIVGWVFALVWNGFSWPLLSVLPRELERNPTAALFGLLFPVAGIGLLVWAVRATLRWRRFGASTFELAHVPGVLGGELAGTLHVGDGLLGARELEARLACIRRYVSGSGKNRSTHEDVLWTEEGRLAGSGLVRGLHGLALPVRIAIPFDCRPSDPLESNDRILWRLELRAELPGVDYHAQFEVPVFETQESDPTRTRAVLAEQRGSAAPLPSGELASGIAVRAHPEGGTEIFFPAGRQPGLAAVFAGIGWVCHVQGAPVPIALFFAAFAALIGYSALSLALGSTRLRVSPDGVRIERRLLIGRSSRNLPAGAIESVEPEVGMRAGSRLYWDLRLRSKDPDRRHRGRRPGTRVAGRLRDKRDAERLAALISSALER
jgi:hypothetical protein